MGWASSHIQDLKNGKTITFRPTGNSMSGKIESGSLVTVRPIQENEVLEKGNIVLCTVNGNEYLHLIKAIGQDGRYQIGNNHGKINGWTKAIYGILIPNEEKEHQTKG